MVYKLTENTQCRKRCKDGKSRNFMSYYLNGELILKQKLPFDETLRKGYDGRWHYKDIYLLNNNIHQTRYDREETRVIKFPASRKVLSKFNIPKDLKINLT